MLTKMRPCQASACICNERADRKPGSVGDDHLSTRNVTVTF